jgi:hypothetical protein
MREERIYIVQSFFIENSCRWFYYLKEGLELFMREERIYIVQSFFKDNLLPKGGSGTVDKRGEDLHCSVLPLGQHF